MKPGYPGRYAMALLALLVSLGVSAADGVRYVNDHLIITLRSGQGNDFRVLKSLPSGTKVELLEEDGDYSRVRTADGTEGWVTSWYLSDTPTAKLLLDGAQQKAQRLESENKHLQADNKELTQSRNSLQQELSDLKRKHTTLVAQNEKLKDVASRPMELENENKRLTADMEKTRTENVRLDSENRTLRNSSVQKWFLAGSGTLVMGVILGLILPRLRRKSTSSWWS
jgi:SH3 domain protein